MKRPFWTLPVILTVTVVAIVLGVANLGLITIAGTGRAIVRYQSTDVSPPRELLAWSFDDIHEGAPEGRGPERNALRRLDRARRGGC